MSTTQPPAQASDEPMLLPCPFCGGKAALGKTTLDERFGYAQEVAAYCTFCATSKKAVGDTSKAGYADNSTVEARAITAWNRRANPRATADVERDAARFDFMMRVADNPEGPDALAVEEIGNEQMETDRPESVQMRELIDAAIAATKGAKP